MNAPYRPALRYLGGKWKLAPKIIPYLPPHRVYVEPFGGAMSVLLRKPKSYAEIYNDLDGDVVNLFRVLRDAEMSARLIQLIRLTPFSREEFDASYVAVEDPVERARRLVVRSFLGHGSCSANIARHVGFRVNAMRSDTPGSSDWGNLPPALEAIARRVQEGGVCIECRPAASIIERFDGPDTLIYCDPPYVQSTRSARFIKGALYNAYACEMSDEDHRDLLEQLLGARSMIVLSGYANPIYDAALRRWRRVEIPTMADGAKPRVEVLWINPAADAGLSS